MDVPNQVQMRCTFSILASLTYFTGISSSMTGLPWFRNTLFSFRNETNSALFLINVCLKWKLPLCWMWLEITDKLVTKKVFLSLFFGIHRNTPIYLEPSFYMLFLPSPFICMFFNGTTKIIHHPVPPPNKMFLSLPFCTSVLCHINALNLAPPDLNPLFALANHFFFLP